MTRERALADLDRTASDYRSTDAEHQKTRRAAVAAVVAALKAGIPPTVVTVRSPFSAAYVRRLAREAGIPAAPPGPKPEG